MKELVALLEGRGCRNIKTYIQSGNVVLQSTEKAASSLPHEISLEINKHRGFAPHVLLLRLEDVERAIVANPFPEAESDPKTLHIGFLDSVPSNPDLKKMGSVKAENERFQLADRIFYLHAPDGVGRSKLAANTERLLGVSMTDRNWRTVCKLRDMAKEVD